MTGLRRATILPNSGACLHMLLDQVRTFEWDPAAYAISSSSQQSWARELISNLHLSGTEHILDVGCGDGKVTAELAQFVPDGSVMGIDSSREMILFAQKTFPSSAIPNLRFEVMDARKIRFERNFDLIFSNAALHWVDDHPAFLNGAANCLRPGGRLLVSCGGKGNAQTVFLAFRAELRQARWRRFFRQVEKPYFFYHPDEYRVWLERSGFEIRKLALAKKDMTCVGGEGLAAWLRTTWHPYTQKVPKELREEFIAAVTQRYVGKYPADSAGLVHVPMVRLEIDAAKRA